ncbi:MAG TPA: TA system VapC family ribonuclease toxin, partial [Terriglobales bacterium]|nr:TA system VapC family ribonuclease toxin [Terriglobales bacterium]
RPQLPLPRDGGTLTAVDTNVLVYALNRQSDFRPLALQLLGDLAENARPWAIPWPCIYECMRVVTHPQVFRPPMATLEAWRQLQIMFTSPTLQLLGETPRHGEILQQVLSQSAASGNLIHDAHVWALCLEHGVSDLVSADRDMNRFRGMRLHNPFV